MNLLLDANISWRLVARLEQHFDSCVHVDSIGLSSPASDTQIWNYALRHKFVIVTNDEDFLKFSNIKGFPPNRIIANRKSEQRIHRRVAHCAQRRHKFTLRFGGLRSTRVVLKKKNVGLHDSKYLSNGLLN